MRPRPAFCFLSCLALAAVAACQLASPERRPGRSGYSARPGASVPKAASGTDRDRATSRRSETSPAGPGAIGMGLSGLADWATAYPFIDFMRTSRRWQHWPNREDPRSIEVDDNGWVRRLKPGQTAGTVFLVTEDPVPAPYARFVVQWEGRGKLEYTVAARRLLHDGKRRRDLIAVGRGSAFLHITETNPDDPIRNISIVPEEFLEQHSAGQVFNPEWLKRVQPFRALRFMDWMQTNNSDQRRWADRPKPTHRTFVVRPGGSGTQGVPVEYMVALANELNADPWFNVPHLANMDYVRRFGELVKARLAPHLTAFFEHSNEVWNWGFQQAQYANRQGRARWGDVGDAYMQWHGMRTARLCDVLKTEVFQAQPERVHCVLGTQADWRGLEKAALECPRWAREGHRPCYRHGLDSLSIAGYFTGCLHEKEHAGLIRKWLAEADGGLQKGLEQVRNGRHFSCKSTVDKMQGRYAYFARISKRHGLALTAYEGGQHIVASDATLRSDAAVTAFFTGLNRHPGMKELYLENLRAWKQAGGTLFTHYSDIGAYGKYGSWGALEYLHQETSPKWAALLRFNDQPCWWSGCSRGPEKGR